MSCIVSLVYSFGKDNKVVRRGNEPRHPSTWDIHAWFVLPGGEKITHSARFPRQTVQTLVPAVGSLIDGLIADHGNEVRSAGWTATTHGAGKRR